MSPYYPTLLGCSCPVSSTHPPSHPPPPPTTTPPLPPAPTPLPHSSPTHLSHTPLPHTSPTHLSHTPPPQEYLAERGVDEALGAYLQDLVWDKENQEYMAWLGAVHGFVAGGGK